MEVDQFVWSILQTGGCSEADEVQIDSQANVRPVFIKSESGSGDTVDTGSGIKPISPASLKVPSLGAWDIPTSKSPGLYAPPDMNSKSCSALISELTYLSQASCQVNIL